MNDILVQMKVAKALKSEKELLTTLSVDEKEDMIELPYCNIILYLGDKVPKEVSKESVEMRMRIDNRNDGTKTN